ncbi:MobC family plasmid mobilization relaxosome protein [Streptococcus suis]|nr:MobC family plasmid mobilization relaxosome protein [Streptococcus suis]
MEENRSRPIQLKFRVDREELSHIRKQMEKAQVPNFASYARQMLIMGEVRQIDFPKLKQLRLEMNRIGVNVNQIAKRVNENGDVGNEDIAECLALLQELKEQTNRLIKDQLKGGN